MADAAEHPTAQAGLALYRKYRPATFAEVRGQEHVTAPLRQALKSGRINHAYLFSGPRGCGKTSSARILARSLNCVNGPTPDPCGVCDSCVALAPSGAGSIDVIEIDAASHGGVDDARDLRERAFYSPVSGRYKIYIIDEAHMVTSQGFNALLKLVEEPPPHLKFIFATTEPEKVIPTIRSRTHHYPFRLMPPSVMRGLAEEILHSEQVSFDPAVLPLVVRAGGGSARDTLSILDQLLAGSDESGIAYDRAVALLGYTDATLIDEIVDAFAAADGAAVFRAVNKVIEGGHEPRRFASDLLDRFRDLIVVASVPDAIGSGLIEVPPDRVDIMTGQASRAGLAQLTRAAEIINTGLDQMRGATSPRLLLELVCAQVLLPGAASDERSVLARLERLESGIGRMPAASAPAAQMAPQAPVHSQAPAAPASPPAPPAGYERAPAPQAAPDRQAPHEQSAPAQQGPFQHAPAQQQGPFQHSPEQQAPSQAQQAQQAPAQQQGPFQHSPEQQAPSQQGPFQHSPEQQAPPQPPQAQQAPSQQGPFQHSQAQQPPAQPGPFQHAPGQSAPAHGTPAPPAPQAPRGTVTTEVIQQGWEGVLQALAARRRVAWMVVRTASVVSLDESVLTLRFPRPGDVKGFTSSGYEGLLKEVVHDRFGINVVIRAMSGGDPGPGERRRPAPDYGAPASQPPITQYGSPQSGGPQAGGQQPAGPAQPSSPPAPSAARQQAASQQAAPFSGPSGQHSAQSAAVHSAEAQYPGSQYQAASAAAARTPAAGSPVLSGTMAPAVASVAASAAPSPMPQNGNGRPASNHVSFGDDVPFPSDDDFDGDELEGSVDMDAASQLTGISLIQRDLGAQIIAEYEE